MKLQRFPAAFLFNLYIPIIPAIGINRKNGKDSKKNLMQII